MATIHGKAGSVTFPSDGKFEEVTSWTIDATADVAEATGMDATVFWKTYLAGFTDWTASVETNWSSSGLAALGDTATLTLTLVSGTTISGNAICTGYGETTDMNDVIKQRYTFQGSGALS